MNRTQNQLAAAGLAIGAIFGLSGSFLTKDPTTQIALYEISSVGLLVASALLTLKFFREGKDLLAAGFLIFALGEAIMSSGAGMGEELAQASFGAGMATYVPAFLLLGLSKGFPLLPRITIILAAVPFLIAAVTIFSGGQALSSSPVVGGAYGLLVLSIIGWCTYLLRESSDEQQVETAIAG